MTAIRRSLPGLWTAVVLAGTGAMGVAYAHTDGGQWLATVVARLGENRALLLLAVGGAVLAGGSARLLAGSTAWARLAGEVLGLGVIAIAVWGNLPAKGAPWMNVPDGLRTVLLLGVGASWGAGWGVMSGKTKRAPAWIFGLPFLATALASSILSHSIHCLFALVWLLALAPAAGEFCWDRLGGFLPVPSASSRRSPIIAFALGLGLLEALGYILGFARLAHPRVLIGVLILLTLALARRVLASLRSGTRLLKEPVRWPVGPAMLAGFLASLLLIQWFASIAPEIGGDALGGRVALPAIWLHHGRISAQPAIELSYMGLGGESLFLLWLPVAGYSVAKIIAFGCLLAIGREIQGPVRRAGSSWALLAMAVFASSTIVWWQFAWGFCDLLQATLLLGAAEALRRWLATEDRRFTIAAGLLAGAATVVKLNGVLLMFAAVAVPVATTLWRRRRIGAAMGAGLWAGVPALAVLLPSLVRSAVLTGNPVFPFANGHFKSPLAPIELSAVPFGLPLGAALRQDFYEVFLTPGKFVELGTYNPLLLPLLAACILCLPAIGRQARYWILAFLIAGGFWLITEQNLRYSLFAGLFATLAVARTAAALDLRRKMPAGTLLPVILALTALATAALEVTRPSFWLGGANESSLLPIRWAFGQETRDTYLRRNYSMYPIAQVLNRSAGPSARTWQMPWLRDHLYFEGQVIAMPHGDIRLLDPLRALMPDQGAALGPAQIAAGLHRSGITHLVSTDDNPWVGTTPESQWMGIYSAEFTDTWLDLMAANWNLRLYRVRDRPVIAHQTIDTLAEMPFVNAWKSMPATEGRLYEFRLIPFPRTNTTKDSVSFAWYNSTGKLIGFEIHSLPDATEGAWHRWLQSAMPGATRLEVRISGNHPASVLKISEIQTRK